MVYVVHMTMTDVTDLDLVGDTPRSLLPALQSFSTAQAARQAGVSFRMLDYWVRCGVIRPSISQAAGSGTQRRFTHEDVVVVRLIARLRRLGAAIGSIDPDLLRAAARTGCRRLLVTPEGAWARADEPAALAHAITKLGPVGWLIDTAA